MASAGGAFALPGKPPLAALGSSGAVAGGKYALPGYKPPPVAGPAVSMPSNAWDISNSQITDLVNNAKQYGLAGTVSTPSGINYSTTADMLAKPAALPTYSPGAPPPLDIMSLWSKMGGAFTPPSSTPLPSMIQAPNPADRTAAEAAAYGMAKDKIGQTQRASMNALAAEMSARGMSDSSFMAGGAGQILSSGQGELADEARTEAEDRLKRQSDVEDRNYAAALAQRGQDIQYSTAADARAMAAWQAKQDFLSRLLAFQTNAGGKLLY